MTRETNYASSSVNLDASKKVSGRESTLGNDGRTTKIKMEGEQNDIEESYVYRGPKNKTGIFKNSLILKDLTGY